MEIPKIFRKYDVSNMPVILEDNKLNEVEGKEQYRVEISNRFELWKS
jgi:hypothetical protein